MNAAQVHLALNHLPLGLVLVGIPLLIGAIRRNSFELRRASLLILFFAGVMVTPVYKSGESAEEMVEHRPGFSEALIHEHEEAGEFAWILTLVLGVWALALLLMEQFKGKVPGLGMLGAVVLFGVLTFASHLRTAHLGGVIRHDEIRDGASQASPEFKAHEEDDD